MGGRGRARTPRASTSACRSPSTASRRASRSPRGPPPVADPPPNRRLLWALRAALALLLLGGGAAVRAVALVMLSLLAVQTLGALVIQTFGLTGVEAAKARGLTQRRAEHR